MEPDSGCNSEDVNEWPLLGWNELWMEPDSGCNSEDVNEWP